MIFKRKFRFWKDGLDGLDGVIVEEKERYAPRKYDTQRVFISWKELDAILDKTEKERAVAAD